MCQLLGVNAFKPVTVPFALQGFLQRGGSTGDHRDGWGMGYWTGQRAHTVHETAPAAHSERAERLCGQGPRSHNFVVHVRKATQGAITRTNCHPFRRWLWGRTWLFAHNGDLGSALPSASGIYSPLGTTDSERAFCLLLDGLVRDLTDGDPHAMAPTPDRIEVALAAQATRLAQHGVFNFLLSDGDCLYAHGSTHLHWVSRCHPFPCVELIDYPKQVDLAHYNHADDRLVVIATQPLTRGEAWQAFVPGELRVFRHGRDITTQHSAQAVLPAVTFRTTGAPADALRLSA